MGRPPRADEANGIYHMLNRGNRREPVFHKTEDFEAFERMMVEAMERLQIKLFAYCLLPNHWHLVVSPEVDGEMGRFGQWLGLTHTQRHLAHYHTAGDGHLYQGRFKSFPVQDDHHFLAVCRYVERNAYTGTIHGWSVRLARPMAVWQSVAVGARNEGGKVAVGSVANPSAPRVD